MLLILHHGKTEKLKLEIPFTHISGLRMRYL